MEYLDPRFPPQEIKPVMQTWATPKLPEGLSWSPVRAPLSAAQEAIRDQHLALLEAESYIGPT
jgi:hypothetical protein